MASASSGLSLPVAVILTENDIPGASLAGRKPSELKNDALKFWLKCRGDNAKGLKTKAMLIKRVEQYIQQGKDKNVIDPDPTQLYTRRKQRRSTIDQIPNCLQDNSDSSTAVRVKYPTVDWSKSLEKMPMFTRAEMDNHVCKTGKRIGNKDHHSVPTSLKKAKTFLNDEYLSEIETTYDQRHFFIKSKCCHSFRKNEPPHQLKLALCIVSGEVLDGTCTCVAGKAGYCNHILALMFKCCKFSLFDCKTTCDLSQEVDENPALACTSILQKWHNKGGGDSIIPQPVMSIMVNKPDLSDSPGNSRDGVKCLLFEARKNPQVDRNAKQMLIADLKAIDPNMGLAQLAAETSQAELTETKFGKSEVGSMLSYQVAFTESNFTAVADLDSVPRGTPVHELLDSYPRFPLKEEDEMLYPRAVTESEEKFLSHLRVNELEIDAIEQNTRKQAQAQEWKDVRMYRFTASKFKIITRRQRNHSTFAESLIHPKSVSSKYVAHGIKYEPIALLEYQRFMRNRRTPVTVLSSGFVVSSSSHILGATPDAKVIDQTCSINFGLAEVKCPQTKFQVTPLDACSDPNFCLERKDDGKCSLKINHEYYAQVQGQMGVTGAQWCDFIVYTSKGLYIERITFDTDYWSDLKEKLTNYYFDHFLEFAVLDFCRNGS